ncbi:nitrous oxide reductase accessory protein NosL [Natronobeatus ordinarius]|uniref:nitrous oxide reductase accessory protein NosL n=1 Tax=Natronobeatus ordinarius TaxID=2963433 RepID=UPI0020CE4E33|nr:nitrous oxide reductase accessory protein NosL [Natronobeatus ordinarius]
MNRRTYLKYSGIALTTAAAGCLDTDGPIEGQLRVTESPERVTIREAIEFAVTVANESDAAQEVTVTADVNGERHSEPTTVAGGDSETVTVAVPTGYEQVEAGALTLGENEWMVEADAISGSERGTVSLQDASVEWYQPDREKLCPVCNMFTERYEGWHAQATHADGSRIEFCALGCAVEYWVHPEAHESEMGYDGKHEGTVENELETIWAPDFTDVDLDPDDGSSSAHPGWESFIDMRDGYFVLDGRTFRKFTTPMPGGSPVCFADYDDALAYVDGDLPNLPDDVDMENVTEDDVVTLEELADSGAGELYREEYQP